MSEKEVTQSDVVKALLLGTAEGLRIQAKAIEDAANNLDAVAAATTAAGMTDDQAGLVHKLMMTSTVGSLELLKSMILSKLLEDLKEEENWRIIHDLSEKAKAKRAVK